MRVSGSPPLRACRRDFIPCSATFRRSGAWSSSIILGQNHKSHHDDSSVVVESNLRFNASNYLTGRFEVVNKEEHVKALTVGYTKDIYRTSILLGGVGGNVTFYDAHGERPRAFYAFARVRLGV